VKGVAVESGLDSHRFCALRRIRLRDEVAGRSLVLLTNHFALLAQLIGELYRRRWQVELFFKWIKQHLRLRGFFGRSPNAVRTQIWSAICACLLVAIARKRFDYRTACIKSCKS
jgi:IS4 transposase